MEREESKVSEYERVKKEALLTEDEVVGIIQNSNAPHFQIAEAQLDKALKHDSIEIKSNNQSLPEKEFILSNENYRYAEAQQDMLKAGFIRVIPKPKRK